MMNKKALPIVLPVVVLLVLLFAKSWGKEKSDPSTKYERILTTAADWLEQAHFSPKKLDDAFSGEVFTTFLSRLDPEKSLLLQSDVDALAKYKNAIDNELRTGRNELSPAASNVIHKRSAETKKIYTDLLAKPFDFSTNETFFVDRKKANWSKNEAEKREYWRKKLKYMVLDRYVEALDMRTKSKDSIGFVVKADSTLEREARDRVRKIWDKAFARQENSLNKQDNVFNIYINTIAQTMDPHTEFFAPVEKRAFDEQISGRFFGIGAQLTTGDDGNVKIVSLITGMPAWKSGEIQVNDAILKVAQGKDQPVDITGYEVSDAVKLIRGLKGTEVKLTMKKPDGSIKVVSLIRDEIIQEETFARSAIVKTNDTKIGYILLPDFYVDLNSTDGTGCAKDVANEVTKLKAENVDGIVLDLRYNGGGSLSETIKMVGLFIEDGPVVQVRGRGGESSVLRDKDKNILYTGPFAVMINEFSASASEIFAGAIQDYGRGVIVGTQSFGKGTVQRQISLDGNSTFLLPAANELGSLKLTIQKFYRISGGSNQLKGILPDVVLPDNNEFTDVREKNEQAALPWDEINKADFTPWADALQYKSVEKEFQSKVDENEAFKKIRNNAKALEELSNRDISLNIDTYRQTQKTILDIATQNKELQTAKTALDISYMNTDKERISKMDKMKSDQFNSWLNGLKTDIYLVETTNILNDVIKKEKLSEKKEVAGIKN